LELGEVKIKKFPIIFKSAGKIKIKIKEKRKLSVFDNIDFGF